MFNIKTEKEKKKNKKTINTFVCIWQQQLFVV